MAKIQKLTLGSELIYPATITEAVKNISGETQEEINQSKQDKLTAGTGILINDDNVISTDGYLLTDNMRQYLLKRLAVQLQDQANELFKVSTSFQNPQTTFYADETAIVSVTNTVNVETKFNDKLVNCDSIPSPYASIINPITPTVGKYLCVLSKNSSNVSAVAWQYTIDDPTSEFNGLTVSKNSDAKSLSYIYPSWYGFISKTDLENGVTQVPDTLTRITRGISNSNITLTQENDEDMYFVIITHNSATAKQLGQSIMDDAVEINSLTSALNSNITLSGYKLYTSTNVFAKGDVEITLTITL